MSDQCQHCTVRGEIERCRKTGCNHHETWYALEIERELAEARRERDAYYVQIVGWHPASSPPSDDREVIG